MRVALAERAGGRGSRAIKIIWPLRHISTNLSTMDPAQTQSLRDRLQRALDDQFELGELLGVGGFAAVFRARDTTLGRDVAVKVLDPAISIGSGVTEELLHEARLVAASEHPHIVPLYEAGERDGLVFLVMRYLPDNLSDRLRREGALEPGDVARLGIEVADALAAAHRQGVVHLDVKPENILLDSQGNAAVTDFGIARAVERADEMPQGLVSGTPNYMSPEQVAGDLVDGRADVYALGIVLYELATGRLPITGKSSSQIMANQVSQDPAPLSAMAPELPAALSDAIMKALSKNPKDRFGSAREMADALREASTPDRLLSPRAARRRRRRRWYARLLLIGGGIAAGMALVVYLAIRVFVALEAGDPPALDAFAPIPTPVADSARALGIVSDTANVRYVFAPAGGNAAEALYITDSEVVVRSAGRIHRYPVADDPDIDVAFVNTAGFLVIALPGAPPDTLFRGLSGFETRSLISGLRRTLLSNR